MPRTCDGQMTSPVTSWYSRLSTGYEPCRTPRMRAAAPPLAPPPLVSTPLRKFAIRLHRTVKNRSASDSTRVGGHSGAPPGGDTLEAASDGQVGTVGGHLHGYARRKTQHDCGACWLAGWTLAKTKSRLLPLVAARLRELLGERARNGATLVRLRAKGVAGVRLVLAPSTSSFSHCRGC